jgi:hypothetical protein
MRICGDMMGRMECKADGRGAGQMLKGRCFIDIIPHEQVYDEDGRRKFLKSFGSTEKRVAYAIENLASVTIRGWLRHCSSVDTTKTGALSFATHSC